jgi:phosphatidylserine/phosphatidylglycerophosphate/cardiolipin synthase-like enzyme
MLVAKGGDAAKSKLPITPQAEKDLKQLADRHKNFRFVYVGNTHRKTLVSDDSFAVVTSFNWLSFKGDPRDRAAR